MTYVIFECVNGNMFKKIVKEKEDGYANSWQIQNVTQCVIEIAKIKGRLLQ